MSGIRGRYFGLKRDGSFGGFIEPELLDIPMIYSPNLGAGEGHWSVPVTTETATQYQDKFSRAAKRIKTEDLVEGIAQLTAYLAVLRTFDNLQRPWAYGFSYTPSQNPIPLGYGSYAFIFPTINGVITYKVINFPAVVAVAVAGAASSMAELSLDVAVAGLEEAY